MTDSDYACQPGALGLMHSVHVGSGWTKKSSIDYHLEHYDVNAPLIAEHIVSARADRSPRGKKTDEEFFWYRLYGLCARSMRLASIPPGERALVYCWLEGLRASPAIFYSREGYWRSMCNVSSKSHLACISTARTRIQCRALPIQCGESTR